MEIGDVVRRHIEGLSSDCGDSFVFVAEDLCDGRPLGRSSAASTACDRFAVSAPYAGRKLRWHVLYDASDPAAPPDVILPPSDDQPTADLSRLPSLSPAKWRADDAAALRRFCAELRGLLRAAHCERALALFPAAHAALRHDFEASAAAADRADVFCDAAARVVTVALPVPFDAAQPPATLQLSFAPGGSSSSAADARLSFAPATAAEFAAATPPALPPFRAAETPLSEYVAKVADAIRAPHTEASARRHCFAALRRVLGSPLEFDAPRFSSIWFAFEDEKGLPVLLHVRLSDGFPADPPIVVLQSGVYNIDGKPLQVRHHRADVPYSPRWSHDELAARLATFVREKLKDFTQACLNTPGMTLY